MRASTILAVAICAAGLSACASDPERRAPSGPLYSLSTLDGSATEVTVAAADLPPAARPAGAPPLGDPALRVAGVGPNGVRIYTIEVRIVRQGELPEVLSAPRLSVYPNQRANISIVNQLSFIQDFDAEVAEEHVIADPIVGVLQDGLTLDVVTAPVNGTERAVDVAFRLLVAELERPMRQRTVRFADWTNDGTIQLPRVAVNSVTGVRRIGVGEEVVVAQLPDPGHGTAVDVRMRVSPSSAPADAAGASELRMVDDFAAPVIARSMGLDEDEPEATDLKAMLAAAQLRNHAGGHLTLEPVAVNLDLDLGVALAEDALRERRAELTDMAQLRVHTTPVPGATASALLQESYVADYDVLVSKQDYAVADPVVDTFLSGITGTVLEGERLRLEWTTTPAVQSVEKQVFDGLTAHVDVPERRTHTVTVPLRAGRQLVPVARTSTGRTAAVWVSFQPE